MVEVLAIVIRLELSNTDLAGNGRFTNLDVEGGDGAGNRRADRGFCQPFVLIA
ncbi:hypothetical protein LP419_19575 [Massilia sp. H-1]|nr:hypothetical protein LP419_19575 [Massilia sp. H-1]